MTDMEMLAALAECEVGRGILCNTTRTKRAASRLVSKGWADTMQAAGLFVARITDAGRAALTSQDHGAKP